MNLPRFTAESSLHRANSSYAGFHRGPVKEGVIPQQQTFLVPIGQCGPCVGGVQQCDYLAEICYPVFTLLGLEFNCYLQGFLTVGRPCPSGPLHVVTG